MLTGIAARGSNRGSVSETEYDMVLTEYEEHEAADLQLRPIDYTMF